MTSYLLEYCYWNAISDQFNISGDVIETLLNAMSMLKTSSILMWLCVVFNPLSHAGKIEEMIQTSNLIVTAITKFETNIL